MTAVEQSSPTATRKCWAAARREIYEPEHQRRKQGIRRRVDGAGGRAAHGRTGRRKAGVILLEEGINDLGGGNQSAIPPMMGSLRTMVRDAHRRDVTVFLATLAPVRAGSPKGGGAFPLVNEANDRIRIMAQNEGATLVDLFTGFGGVPGPYIDADGLHPNALGYQKMAEIFFDPVRGTSKAPWLRRQYSWAQRASADHARTGLR